MFIINTKEVVDALTSMKEAGPMDFGDCYKVRMADSEMCRHGKKVRFPDPRTFVSSLGLDYDGETKIKSRWSRWRQSFVLQSSGHTFPSEDSFTSTSSESSICNSEENSPPQSLPELTFDYGQGITREELISRFKAEEQELIIRAMIQLLTE